MKDVERFLDRACCGVGGSPELRRHLRKELHEHLTAEIEKTSYRIHGRLRDYKSSNDDDLKIKLQAYHEQLETQHAQLGSRSDLFTAHSKSEIQVQ